MVGSCGQGLSSDLELARQMLPPPPVSVQWGLHALLRLPLGEPYQPQRPLFLSSPL